MRLSRLRSRRGIEKVRRKGEDLIAAERVGEAYEFLSRAVDQFPRDAGVRISFATTLLAYRPDEVRQEAIAAAELGFDDPVVLVRAAHLLVGRGAIDVALPYAERAEELAGLDFPLPTAIDSVIGQIAAREEDFGAAEARFRKALRQDPSDNFLQFRLAQLLSRTGRRDGALW